MFSGRTAKPLFLAAEVAFSPPLSAFDQDSGVNSPLTYAITSGNDDGYFSIDTATGLVYQTEEIDREELVRRRKVNETDALEQSPFLHKRLRESLTAQTSK